MNTIVVGVDGSPGGMEALRVAAREAKAHGAALRVVTAWHVPAYAYGGIGFAPLADVERSFATQAKDTLDEAIAELGELADGIALERVVAEGRAASILVDEAKGADLLVVGSRGLGGFGGLLLGSVSQECAQHAPCNVLIVRGAHDGEDPAGLPA